MATYPQPYSRSLDDEFDWNLLDELYGVASQISNFCFETKKFCVTTEFVVLALIVKFTNDKLDHSLFVAGLVVPICFWILDAVAFYYQVKIRGKMERVRKDIKSRHEAQLVSTAGEPVIAAERVQKSQERLVFDAIVNHSMWIYVFLICADILTWSLFIDKRIV